MSSSSSSKKRRTQKDYTLLTQEEQCLRNPDMYVGSVNVEKNNDFEHHDWAYYFDGVLTKKYPIPALNKLVDELLVNIMDVYTKNGGSAEEEPVKNVWITTNYETGEISVKNDGTGVPVEIHELASKALQKSILCPELVWFHFGSGDNFTGDRIVGGKNGYGAKLCGVFSSKYEVKTCDGKGKVFKMVAKDNMKVKSNASVKSSNASAYTKITFTIDLKRFSENGHAITNVPVDTQFAINERIQDLANFMPDVKVKLNGTRIKPKTLAKQAKEILGKVLFQHETDNYFIAVGPRKEDGGSGCCSYVNGTFNRNGGKHINQLLSALNNGMQQVSKSYKAANLNRFQLSRRLLVFASLKNVVNVMYDGQCKDEVKSASNLRCPIRYDIKEHAKYFKALGKHLKDYIEKKKSASENREARATDGQGSSRYVNVEDLTDARLAGGVWSQDCALFITEGKSAARLALEMLPKDKNGVLPIRGKMKNAGKHSKADFNKNKEVISIKQALGLKQNTKSIDNLRYGKLVIMTDQDSDGYHIRMLLLSMFAEYWPQLIAKGFIWIFETPIVRATKGTQTLNFYDQCKVEEHVQNNQGWSYKYYKGLGTSTATEAREYYSHKSDLMWKVNGDVKLIKTCMGKGNDSHAYRRWISSGETALPITNEADRGSVEFIVKRQFGNFCDAQNGRKIPSMIDGLVPSMRKVLLYALKNFADGDNDNIVDRFANRAADKMKYHHGSSNLIGVIVNMASDYVGGITLPYFYKGGQFASRHDNEHAAGRYLKTGLLPHVKLLYPPVDIQFFPEQIDDGEIIEPKYMVPIVPMIFVNGHKGGLGVGYLSEIPPHSLKFVIRMVRTILTATSQPDIMLVKATYAGFKGKVAPAYTEGVYTKTNDEIEVTELPIGLKTDKFIEAIRKHTPRIEFMKDHGVGDNIHLKILGCEEAIVKKLMKRPIRQSWVTYFPNGSINDLTIDSRHTALSSMLNQYMSEREKIYHMRKAKIAADLKKEHEKWTIKATVIKTYLDEVWCAKDLENPFEWSDVCLKINGTNNGEVVPLVCEDDLDVSIRKLNRTQYDNFKSKALSCKTRMEEVLNKPIKLTWLEELKELEEKIYGVAMEEETVAVGEKRDFTY